MWCQYYGVFVTFAVIMELHYYRHLLMNICIYMNECIYDDMIYLTAIGLSPGGSSAVHIYTQIIHRTTQNKQYIEQHNNFGRVRAVPRLG